LVGWWWEDHDVDGTLKNGSKTKFTDFIAAKFSQHIILVGFVSFCLFLQKKIGHSSEFMFKFTQ